VTRRAQLAVGRPAQSAASLRGSKVSCSETAALLRGYLHRADAVSTRSKSAGMLAGSARSASPTFRRPLALRPSTICRGVRHPLRGTGVVARAVPQEVDEDITPGRARPVPSARPMPELAPVTSATRPRSPESFICCIHLEVAVSLLCLARF